MKQRGLFSQKAADKFGTVTWADDKTGTEYEITAYDDPANYFWDDAIVVCDGPMTYIRGRLTWTGYRI